MIDTSLRQRPLALLAALLLAQVLLLAFQIKRDHDVRLIRYWAAAIVMPFERGGTDAVSHTGGIWSNYISLRGAHAENARLRAELDQVRLQNRQLAAQAGEAQRLSAILNFREAHPETQMLAAQVISASADPASHTLYLNRGDRDHVRRNQPVITPDGIVGKIVEVLQSTSQVLLINDKDSGAGALLADTRTHGVVKGSGDPDARLDYVINEEQVHAGEMVLTSGEDRIFPKDLLIGTVSMATPGNPFQNIHVKPAARLDRLEDVIILLTPQELKKGVESADAPGASANSPGIVQREPEQPSKPVVAASGKAAAPPNSSQPASKAPATAPTALPSTQPAPPAPKN
jgi:rod shape-determining protein MreC